jgi:hypothetical protein
MKEQIPMLGECANIDRVRKPRILSVLISKDCSNSVRGGVMIRQNSRIRCTFRSPFAKNGGQQGPLRRSFQRWGPRERVSNIHAPWDVLSSDEKALHVADPADLLGGKCWLCLQINQWIMVRANSHSCVTFQIATPHFESVNDS